MKRNTVQFPSTGAPFQAPSGGSPEGLSCQCLIFPLGALPGAPEGDHDYEICSYYYACTVLYR